ncbi:MAG: caspase family protein [Methylobacterium sp.]|uniref:caspase family protein n=1 Tax=Methylobacterium sp. TaxID=409 RepID=UPI00258F4E3A|nr:caspase family protein [Methylobacterium sp.]MBY0298102.1 caspase family protein [Methylobacterium sp.]
MRALWVVGILLAVSMCQTLQPAIAQSRQGDRIALVIGNAQYPDSDAPLTTPVQDARALAAALQQKGFAVDVQENTTKRTLQEAVNRLYDKVKAGTVVLFYFSGYGIQSNKQNYLVPVDAQIWSEADLRRDGIGVDALLSELHRRGADLKYVVLDAANRNPFERRFRSFSTGLAPVGEPPPNTVVFYSAQPGLMLRQVTTAKSVFAEELSRHIAGADGVSRPVFDRVRTAVSNATQNTQVPWVYSSLKDSAPGAWTDPRPVAAAPERPAPAPAPAPAPVPAEKPVAALPEKQPPRVIDIPAPVRPDTPRPAEPAPDPAAEFGAAKRTGTKAAYERFLAKFPTGAWAERARAEIEKLDPAPKPAPKVAVQVVPYTREDERLKAELNRVLERNPTDASALYRRGQLYAIHREYNLAVADFDEVIRLNPQDVEALNNRCWVRAMMDELDRALRDCNEALKLKPNFPDALDSRGLVNLKIGLPGLAIRDYDAALKGNGRQASSLYGRGLARVRTGEAEEGRSDINDALRMDPGLEKEFAQYGLR